MNPLRVHKVVLVLLGALLSFGVAAEGLPVPTLEEALEAGWPMFTSFVANALSGITLTLVILNMLYFFGVLFVVALILDRDWEQFQEHWYRVVALFVVLFYLSEASGSALTGDGELIPYPLLTSAMLGAAIACSVWSWFRERGRPDQIPAEISAHAVAQEQERTDPEDPIVLSERGGSSVGDGDRPRKSTRRLAID